MTASGGWEAIQVVVFPCCSRAACEVTKRLPNAAASSVIACSTTAGSSLSRMISLSECASNERLPRSISEPHGPNVNSLAGIHTPAIV